ncbi:MAG: hypothetical protein IT562_08185 [Alphaproteobacteria bacterium]|nr:hypothetical protein [Alphaproteobacteria bacterium]
MLDDIVGTLGSAIPEKWGTWPGGSIAWGGHRVRIKPEAATETYGRTGFSIHGGAVPGSAGCIDLTRSIDPFVKMFRDYGKDLKLYVDYGRE